MISCFFIRLPLDNSGIKIYLDFTSSGHSVRGDFNQEEDGMSNDLVIFQTLTPLAVFGSKRSVDDIIDKVRAEVADAPKDISTEAGELEIGLWPIRSPEARLQ